MILTATYWSTGRGYRLFRYKVVSIQVYLVADVLIVSRTRLKERRIFTQNVSLFKRKLYLQ